MKYMEDYYLKKFAEAVELGDEKMMEEMNRKHTRLVRQGEARSLSWALFAVFIFALLSPFIHWWLIGWRYGL